MIFEDAGDATASTKQRLSHRPLNGEVRDGAALGVVAAVRVVRTMVLWIALYFVDRAYQEAYVQRVLVGDDGDDGDRGDPPRLWTIAAAALAIEAVILAMLGVILFLLSARFKSPKNSFLIDGPLLRRLAVDYAGTTTVLLLLGAAMGAVTQDTRNFRYREDGLRGIRALCVALLLVAFVVINEPTLFLREALRMMRRR